MNDFISGTPTLENPAAITRGVAGLLVPALAPPPPPKPIDDREPQVTTLARELIRKAAEGQLAPEQFTPEMRERLFPDRVKEGQEMLQSLGPLQSIALLQRREADGVRSYQYRITFRNESLRLYLSLNGEDKITGLGFSPD